MSLNALVPLNGALALDVHNNQISLNPTAGVVPSTWTVVLAGMPLSPSTATLSWNYVMGSAYLSDQTVSLDTPSGTIRSPDPISPMAQLTFVAASSGGTAGELRLFVDGGLEVATPVTLAPPLSGNAVMTVANAYLSELRVFDAAIDPSTQDLFWFDDSSKSYPSSLRAVYDFYSSPPTERISQTPINLGASQQVLLAGARFWNGGGADILSSEGLSVTSTGPGFSVQAWVYIGDRQSQDFNVCTMSGSGVEFSLTIGANRLLAATLANNDATNTDPVFKTMWLNIAATVGDGFIRLYVNGVTHDQAGPVTPFTADTFTMGGYVGGAAPVGAGHGVQNLQIFNRILTDDEVLERMYSAPIDDPSCVGYFQPSDQGPSANFVTGQPTQAAVGATYVVTANPAAAYGPAPTPSERPFERLKPRPLSKPSAEAMAAYLTTACATPDKWFAEAEPEPLRDRLEKDAYQHPDGRIVTVGQVIARIEGETARFDVVTHDGLVEIEGLSVPADQSCALWMTEFIGTAFCGVMLAFFAIPGTWRGFKEVMETIFADTWLYNQISTMIASAGGAGGAGITPDWIMALIRLLYERRVIAMAVYNIARGFYWHEVARIVLTVMTVMATFWTAPYAWVARLVLSLAALVIQMRSLLASQPANCPGPNPPAIASPRWTDAPLPTF